MITFDPAKSERNRALRGLPFDLANEFEFETAVINEDTRFKYPEVRYLATGMARWAAVFNGVLSLTEWISRDLVA
ncbi:MAG: BrnT family toxin [Methylobacteriaceae bacterium]|nr:BrnT family toxin [Methylobacteriaceae bacterium]